MHFFGFCFVCEFFFVFHSFRYRAHVPFEYFVCVSVVILYFILLSVPVQSPVKLSKHAHALTPYFLEAQFSLGRRTAQRGFIFPVSLLFTNPKTQNTTQHAAKRDNRRRVVFYKLYMRESCVSGARPVPASKNINWPRFPPYQAGGNPMRVLLFLLCLLAIIILLLFCLFVCFYFIL